MTLERMIFFVSEKIEMFICKTVIRVRDVLVKIALYFSQLKAHFHEIALNEKNCNGFEAMVLCDLCVASRDPQ